MFKEKNIVIVGLVFFILVVVVFYYFNTNKKSTNVVDTDDVNQSAIEAGVNDEQKELRKIDESDHFFGQSNAPYNL